MSYYNGLIRPANNLIEFNGMQKSVSHITMKRAQNGLDYRDWPILLRNEKNDFEVKAVHWEYIPSVVQDEHDLFEARIMNHWLNIKVENLLKNDRGKASLFREGALHGRCLVLSSGFYDYRSVLKIGKRGQALKQTERIPYYITLKDRPPYFFMAGISRVWVNQSRQQSALTFGIVTTKANDLLQNISNVKMRMPVILNHEEAAAWLLNDLTNEEIMHMGSYQYPAQELIAWPVAKDFLQQEKPEEECHYDQLPAIL